MHEVLRAGAEATGAGQAPAGLLQGAGERRGDTQLGLPPLATLPAVWASGTRCSPPPAQSSPLAMLLPLLLLPSRPHAARSGRWLVSAWGGDSPEATVGGGGGSWTECHGSGRCSNTTYPRVGAAVGLRAASPLSLETSFSLPRLRDSRKREKELLLRRVPRPSWQSRGKRDALRQGQAASLLQARRQGTASSPPPPPPPVAAADRQEMLPLNREHPEQLHPSELTDEFAANLAKGT